MSANRKQREPRPSTPPLEPWFVVEVNSPLEDRNPDPSGTRSMARSTGPRTNKESERERPSADSDPREKSSKRASRQPPRDTSGKISPVGGNERLGRSPRRSRHGRSRGGEFSRGQSAPVSLQEHDMVSKIINARMKGPMVSNNVIAKIEGPVRSSGEKEEREHQETNSTSRPIKVEIRRVSNRVNGVTHASAVMATSDSRTDSNSEAPRAAAAPVAARVNEPQSDVTRLKESTTPRGSTPLTFQFTEKLQNMVHEAGMSWDAINNAEWAEKGPVTLAKRLGTQAPLHLPRPMPNLPGATPDVDSSRNLRWPEWSPQAPRRHGGIHASGSARQQPRISTPRTAHLCNLFSTSLNSARVEGGLRSQAKSIPRQREAGTLMQSEANIQMHGADAAGHAAGEQSDAELATRGANRDGSLSSSSRSSTWQSRPPTGTHTWSRPLATAGSDQGTHPRSRARTTSPNKKVHHLVKAGSAGILQEGDTVVYNPEPETTTPDLTGTLCDSKPRGGTGDDRDQGSLTAEVKPHDRPMSHQSQSFSSYSRRSSRLGSRASSRGTGYAPLLPGPAPAVTTEMPVESSPLGSTQPTDCQAIDAADDVGDMGAWVVDDAQDDALTLPSSGLQPSSRPDFPQSDSGAAQDSPISPGSESPVRSGPEHDGHGAGGQKSDSPPQADDELTVTSRRQSVTPVGSASDFWSESEQPKNAALVESQVTTPLVEQPPPAAEFPMGSAASDPYAPPLGLTTGESGVQMDQSAKSGLHGSAEASDSLGDDLDVEGAGWGHETSVHDSEHPVQHRNQQDGIHTAVEPIVRVPRLPIMPPTKLSQRSMQAKRRPSRTMNSKGRSRGLGNRGDSTDTSALPFDTSCPSHNIGTFWTPRGPPPGRHIFA